MKKILIILTFLNSVIALSQVTEGEKGFFKKFRDNLSGSLESNIQWYNDDSKLGKFDEKHRLRSNNYLRLDYNALKNLTVGLQLESYAPLHLINYYPGYNETNLSTYYIRYKNEKIDVTAGYFYEQFGSGLLLRAFEERQLGLNNALRGLRVKYNPTSFLNFTTLFGQTKVAFDVSNSSIFGFDSEIDFVNAFNLEGFSGLTFGFSYVGKYEKFKGDSKKFNTTNFPQLVNSYAFRFDMDLGKFYTSTEFSLKGNDIAYTPASKGSPRIIEGKYFKGNALLFTLGFNMKGLGVSSTFRRLENMAFFAEREFAKPGGNQFLMQSLNYIPSLTKLQDYSLANIYVYQSQPSLSIASHAGQAGEIGNQFDFYYNIKKGSFLGGKYGTKIAGNLSYWALLDAEFNEKNSTYSTSFLGFGKRLNRDFSIEVRKKWTRKWSMIFTYLNQMIDKGVALGGPVGVQGDIKTDVVALETTIKLGGYKSIRLEGQHLWTDKDLKNWLGGTAELNLDKNFSFYASNMVNYEKNDLNQKRVHYYNFGGSYRKGATRIAVNYGRQRGGLLCVGGVCRIVSPNTGLTVSINTFF